MDKAGFFVNNERSLTQPGERLKPYDVAEQAVRFPEGWLAGAGRGRMEAGVVGPRGKLNVGGFYCPTEYANRGGNRIAAFRFCYLQIFRFCFLHDRPIIRRDISSKIW